MRVEVRKLGNALERASRADPICKLFRTIPGVGPLTALAFKATIDDPRRFKRSKLVPAHLGLTPNRSMMRTGRQSDRDPHGPKPPMAGSVEPLCGRR